MNMHVSHVDDLIDAYALGALEPDEVDLVEQHIETCARCRALVESARSLGDDLLTAVPQVAPPPDLRANVLARIHAEKAQTNQQAQINGNAPHETTGTHETPPVPAQPPAARQSAIARLLHSLFGGVPETHEATGALLRDLLAEPDCEIWPVGGTADAPTASARLIATRSRHEAVLITNGLPATGAGKAYQVWFLRGGQPLPNALFEVDRRGHGSSILRMPTPVTTFDTVAVTPEPESGSPSPTGPIVLAGSIG